MNGQPDFTFRHDECRGINVYLGMEYCAIIIGESTFVVISTKNLNNKLDDVSRLIGDNNGIN